MKRFIVKMKMNDKIYPLKLYYSTLEECKKANPSAISIEECLDYEYLQYIDEIKESGRKISDNFYEIPIDNGIILVKFAQEEGLMLDFLEYQKHINTVMGNEITWTWSNPKEFYELFLKNGISKMKLYSFRSYGQPKLTKPKELKGIKQSFTCDFIPKKCKCACFIKDNDLYIKHRDYFSKELEVEEEDFDKPLEYLCKKYLGKDKNSKFVYPDCWGSIILRNEAWIKVENILPKTKIMSELEMKECLFKLFRDMTKLKRSDFCDGTWERFWESVSKELYKFLEGGVVNEF